MSTAADQEDAPRTAALVSPGASRPALRLALLGLGAAGLYAGGLALRHPLGAGIRLPRHDWAQLAGGATVLALLLHLALYSAVGFLYISALRLLLKQAATLAPTPARADPGLAGVHRRLLAVIIAGWLLASLALTAVAPGGEAHDVFDYLFRGRMLVEEGSSPLADAPENFPERPFYRYVTWTDHVDTYGPLWEYASGATAAAVTVILRQAGRWDGGAGQCPASPASCFVLLTYVQAYRILAVVLAGVCGWLIYRLVGSASPALAPAALLAWLWNPLLLISSAVGAHNDLLMLALVLASFWALQRRWLLAALLLFVLAAHVKLTALTLAPLYGLWLVRQLGWRLALGYGAAAAASGLVLSSLLYAPLGGWDTLPRMLEERERYVALSFHHLLYRLLYEQGVEAGLLRLLTIRGPSLLYAAGSVTICAFMVGWRRADPAQPETVDMRVFWRTATAVNLFYLLVGSFWFQPWYVLWALAPAVLLPASRFTYSVLPWLCAGALYGNVVATYLPQLPGPPLQRTGRVAVTVFTTWLPAAIAAFLVWWTPRATIGRQRGKKAE